jgi:MFS family permease
MIESLVALVGQQVGPPLRRAAGAGAAALIAGLFLLFAVAGLFAALFFWLAPDHGPMAAALICAAVALALALVSALPLLIRPRKPPPNPAQDPLPQLLTLMAKSPKLTPGQLVLAAAVVGFTLFASSRRGEKR